MSRCLNLDGSEFFSFDYSLCATVDFAIAVCNRQGIIEHSLPLLYEPAREGRLTVWHRFLVADVIDRLVSGGAELGMDGWIALVDLCAELVARSELADSDWLPDPDKTEPEAPRTSTEFWAWEFGRVAALAGSLDEKDIYDPEVFESWDSGLVALNLLLSTDKPPEWLLRRCWAGALVTWGATRGNVEYSDGSSRFETKVGKPGYPSDLVRFTHLYWMMRLGFLDARQQIERRVTRGESQVPAHPAAPDILLLGSSDEIGRVMLEAQERARQDATDRVTTQLMEQLPQVWERLPEDAQQHLIDGEVNLERRNAREASLDYANAVEAALDEWLPKPRDAHSWPEGLGGWSGALDRMARRSRQRDHENEEFRRRFDIRAARELCQGLNLVRKARLSRAHSERRPPLARKTRGIVLGIQQDSIFTSILKFARRWRG